LTTGNSNRGYNINQQMKAPVELAVKLERKSSSVVLAEMRLEKAGGWRSRDSVTHGAGMMSTVQDNSFKLLAGMVLEVY